MLSTIFCRPLNTIRLALRTFENFGMIQIVNEQGIFITNWEKYQNIAGMEQIKEYNRLAKRRQREREKELKLLYGINVNVIFRLQTANLRGLHSIKR